MLDSILVLIPIFKIFQRFSKDDINFGLTVTIHTKFELMHLRKLLWSDSVSVAINKVDILASLILGGYFTSVFRRFGRAHLAYSHSHLLKQKQHLFRNLILPFIHSKQLLMCLESLTDGKWVLHLTIIVISKKIYNWFGCSIIT